MTVTFLGKKFLDITKDEEHLEIAGKLLYILERLSKK
jgi:hypothetical protein